jgi:type II secretory ATPase GspE/PulE/Tfp pilus assembly ATPase PilB-like protein
MGVESFLIGSTLNVVLAQRLVRRICENCKTQYEAPQELVDTVAKVVTKITENTVLMSKDIEVTKIVKSFDPQKFKLSKGKGCQRCGNTGYKGRLGIYELLPMTDEIAALTVENSPANKIEDIAVKQGMCTLAQDGYLRVIEGTTTLEEVMRVTS